ncbi:MAG: hypothetical protein F6K54_36215 [Okeania sp. SIO3B5]|uniref:hypothetical protein n=1 Tax=Okeania sp. SIO3B5 TaxID=2607811 RepID=UPI0013FEAA4F|nr:hypothetical protein [Okeania sp. SIO3B5]NEO58028.1 hypothetical protein [Okeania sp. SIO3B5]
MNKIKQFKLRLGHKNIENFTTPPDDPLGELSDFELGLRKFCYEFNRQVIVEIGQTKFKVFLDPDICILLEDRFTEQIGELEQDQIMGLYFVESYWCRIKFVPVDTQIKCYLKEFNYYHQESLIILNKQQVLTELKQFLTELMSLVVNQGYISLQDRDEFIKPAFVQSEVLR